MRQYDPTDAQKKAFAENQADFRRLADHVRGVQETARARLAAHGLEPDRGGGIPCLACTCPDFEPGGKLGSCDRSDCQHSLLNHDRPI